MKNVAALTHLTFSFEIHGNDTNEFAAMTYFIFFAFKMNDMGMMKQAALKHSIFL